jgi:large subunit ribosomal protein L4
MSKITVLDRNGKKVSELTVAKDLFSYPVKDHLLYEAVVNYRANQRRGTASTKTRNEVRGGGRKPWRQKGTGRARAGSIRSPIWRKGGVTFGPKPRQYGYKLPKKIKRNALRSALALKWEEKKILILKVLEFKEPKTKEGANFLSKLKLDSALIVDSHENKNLFLSLRNLPKVKVVDTNLLTVYDVLSHEWLVFSQTAFESMIERLR